MSNVEKPLRSAGSREEPLKKRNQGFTLIELLVVIAIISILAAILFPVFARARENARRVSCLSNLKQLALGVQMYSQDYDERIPPCYQWNGPTVDYLYSWTALIQPYVKSTQVTICPDWSEANVYGDLNLNPPLSFTSYTAPLRCTTDASGVGLSLASFPTPSETIYGMDGKECQLIGLCDHFYMGSPSLSTVVLANSLNQNAAQYAAHFDGNNAFFMDGHAKWMKTIRPSMLSHDNAIG